jgi:hypothetical protein
VRGVDFPPLLGNGCGKIGQRRSGLDTLTRDIVLMKDRETCWYVCTGLNKRLQPSKMMIDERISNEHFFRELTTAPTSMGF